MEESFLVTQNETTDVEYQITIKQEPITEELEETPSVDTNDVLNANNSMLSSEETRALAPVTIKSERIESESLASPIDTSACPNEVHKPSESEEITVREVLKNPHCHQNRTKLFQRKTPLYIFMTSFNFTPSP